ncbi:predicted protein [Nematostella vectensis]|uniref:E3 ubiquitin-protein ligase n=1 Tax=Nematostella vectensis TaxID=45351 RepID=A7SKA9_NEMVE|nr:predicted protein [Nematostella vectensis]|eukprot:XP_001627938.1 predicted protein [Nematostella vectensis]
MSPYDKHPLVWGLRTSHFQSISLNLHELAETRIGSPMLFELIEDSHCFTKTECYHYFHCSCLARYIDHTIKMSKASGDDKQEQAILFLLLLEIGIKVVCPMCRLPISYDLEALKAAPHETTPEEVAVYKPDNKTKRRQKELAALYQRQLQKGGIIDVEQEKNKFLIDITSTPEPSTTEPTSDASSSCDGQGTVDQVETAQDMFQNPGLNSAYEKPAQPHRPGSGRGRNRQYDRGRGGGRKWEERHRNKSRRKEVLNENERDDGMKLGQNYISKQNIHKKDLGGDKPMQIGQERADNIDAQSSEGNRKNTEKEAGTLNEMFSADSRVITETELDSKDTTADNLDGSHKYTRKVPQRDDGPRGREDFKGPRGNNMGRTPNQKREKGAATKPRKSPGSDTRRHTKNEPQQVDSSCDRKDFIGPRNGDAGRKPNESTREDKGADIKPGRCPGYGRGKRWQGNSGERTRQKAAEDTCMVDGRGSVANGAFTKPVMSNRVQEQKTRESESHVSRENDTPVTRKSDTSLAGKNGISVGERCSDAAETPSVSKRRQRRHRKGGKNGDKSNSVSSRNEVTPSSSTPEPSSLAVKETVRPPPGFEMVQGNAGGFSTPGPPPGLGRQTVKPPPGFEGVFSKAFDCSK